jgi:hypothetical protein
MSDMVKDQGRVAMKYSLILWEKDFFNSGMASV